MGLFHKHDWRLSTSSWQFESRDVVKIQVWCAGCSEEATWMIPEGTWANGTPAAARR